MNFIQSYWEMKFTGNSQSCFTLLQKSLSRRKKMEYEQKKFFKSRRPRIWAGGWSAVFYKNDVISENIDYHSAQEIWKLF